MSASPEALHAVRTVARHLGPLRERVVFVGGAIRGFLITDPAVEGSRATKDVDVIAAGIATTHDYYEQIVRQLRSLGFREDARENAPLCRWTLLDLVVDVMPPVSDVLGFSNRWYLHAVETASRFAVTTASGDDPIEIRLITAPLFLATKLEAFNGRGHNDYEASHDIEDIVAVVDGRSSLVREIEHADELVRDYVAAELAKHLPGGLDDALPGHLGGDLASQARLPLLRCALDRLRRRPTLAGIGRPTEGGEPGATGTTGRWRYEIVSIAREARNSRDHITVRVKLTNLGHLAGTVGDGREVRLEDARGILFPPVYKLTVPAIEAAGLAGVHDQAVPDAPIETCWAYEVPRGSRELRLLIPKERSELIVE